VRIIQYPKILFSIHADQQTISHFIPCIHEGDFDLTSPTRDAVGIPRGSGLEARRARIGLGEFDAEASQTWQLLRAHFSSGITLNELRSVAIVVEYITALVVPRAAKRTFPVLVKWFSDNWAFIEPILLIIHLIDDGGQVINFSWELSDTF
jgi:hypothetical protein